MLCHGVVMMRRAHSLDHESGGRQSVRHAMACICSRSVCVMAP